MKYTILTSFFLIGYLGSYLLAFAPVPIPSLDISLLFIITFAVSSIADNVKKIAISALR